MTVLNFPDVPVKSVEWSTESNSQTSSSPFDPLDAQTVARPGSGRWLLTIALAAQLTAAEARLITAFVSAMNGETGRCYIYDHAQPNPAGVATGAPLVNGAGQTGFSLVTDGWTPNTAGILLEGDRFGTSGQLVVATSDVASDAAGNATIPIWPAIRSAPADNSALVLASPTAKFKFTADKQIAWYKDGSLFVGGQLSFEEAR